MCLVFMKNNIYWHHLINLNLYIENYYLLLFFHQEDFMKLNFTKLFFFIIIFLNHVLDNISLIILHITKLKHIGVIMFMFYIFK